MKAENNIKEAANTTAEAAKKVIVNDEELNKTTGGRGVAVTLAYSDDEKNTGNGTIYGNNKV
ncbi:MAG: hypothetical protein K6C96_04205 [Butyrivibrio sp.]|nr:hypothetical protein [Butyrivibrio sp.]